MSNSKRKAIKDGNITINDNKTVVAAYVERCSNVRFAVIDQNETEKGLLVKHVEKTSCIMTDSATTLKTVGRSYSFHGIVDHSKSEYV